MVDFGNLSLVASRIHEVVYEHRIRRKRMAVTIRDVANRAGVAVGTVSRVVNNRRM